jgi:hypothetical protein
VIEIPKAAQHAQNLRADVHSIISGLFVVHGTWKFFSNSGQKYNFKTQNDDDEGN